MKQTIDFFADVLIFFIYLSLLYSLNVNIFYSVVPFGIYLFLIFIFSRKKSELQKQKVKYYGYVVTLVIICLVSSFEIWFRLLDSEDFIYRNWILALFPTFALTAILFFKSAQILKPQNHHPEKTIDLIYARSSLMMSFFAATVFCSLSLIGLKAMETVFHEFTYFTDKFVKRGIIPPLTMFLFYWGVWLYVLRAIRLVSEFQNIERDCDALKAINQNTNHNPQPEDSTPAPVSLKSETVRMIQGNMDRLPSEGKESFVIHIVDEIWSRAKSFYMLPGWINWSIPILGFLGTVLGISMASEGIARIISSPEGIGKLATDLSIAIYPLGIAFDTTLISLSLSLVLMLIQTMVQKWEEKNLLNIETYIQSIPRLEKNSR